MPVTEPARPGCVVCDFVETSARRRIFFTLVEGLGEFWFLQAMEAGGFCVRHARDVVAAGGGPGLTSAFLDVLNGWTRRFDHPSRPDARVGQGCYLCETESWAEAYAVDVLARGDRGYAVAQLGRGGPACLRHLERVIRRVSWSRVPELATELGNRRQGVVGMPVESIASTIAVIAGSDPNANARRAEATIFGSSPDPDAFAGAEAESSWAAGVLSMRGLRRELTAGRCPACTAAGAAIRTYLGWLADEQADPERVRDRDALCADHLHDAGATAPEGAARAVAESLEHWARSSRVLTDMPLPPTGLAARLRGVAGAWTEAWRRSHGRPRLGAAAGAALERVLWPGRRVEAALQLAGRQRHRPCVACQAAITAADRSLDLLGALLAGSAGVRFYEDTNGLCLRHVGAAVGRLAGPEREAVRSQARARSREVRWELEESIRKSNWSVRYEPRGAEGSAWQRAMVFVLGDAALATDYLATEPPEPRPAV
jgi:hypothetical protein